MNGGGANDPALGSDGQVEGAPGLGDVAAVLGALRSRMAAGEAPDAVALQRLLEPVPPALAEAGPLSRGAQLAVLDELDCLIGELERERAALRQRIAGWRRARQAEASYGTGRWRS